MYFVTKPIEEKSEIIIVIIKEGWEAGVCVCVTENRAWGICIPNTFGHNFLGTDILTRTPIICIRRMVIRVLFRMHVKLPPLTKMNNGN